MIQESTLRKAVGGTTRLQRTLSLLAITLAAFALARLYLLLLNAEAFAGLDNADIGQSFLLGLRFDIAAVLLVLAIPLVLMNLPLGFASKPSWFNTLGWVSCLLVCLMALVLIADVNFYSHMGRHISDDLAAIQQETNTTEVARHAWATGISITALLALIAAWWWVLRRPLLDSGGRPVVFVLLLAALVVGIRGHVHQGRPMAVVDAFSDGNLSAGNLRLNGVYTLLKGVYSARHGTERAMTAQEAYRAVGPLLGGDDPEYPFTRTMAATGTARNIVLIILESWSASFVDSISGAGVGATPEFDALARDGLLFRRFYATHENSIRALQAALTGFPRLPGMATAGHALDSMSHMTRFGALVRSQGYATLFVQPSARHAWRYDSVVASLGFEDYYSAEDIPLRRDYPDPAASSTGWDYETLMFGLEKINALGEPFVAALVTGTSHKPFPDPGQPFRDAHPPAANSEAAFLATLRYSDWALGEFMDEARATPWFEHTAFVLFADHGVHRLPGVGIQANNMRERNHVPLLIYFPAGLDAGETDVIGSQLNILPTLMDLAGFSGRYAALGESLLGRQSGWAFVSDASGGNGIGLIADDGFVRHDLRRRQEAGGNDDPAVVDRLERSLLALDAAVYHAIRSNHWLRPGEHARMSD